MLSTKKRRNPRRNVSRRRNKPRLVEKATEAFNADASVRTLQQAARSEDPTECANFLRKSAAGGRLSPSAIGELLGSHEADALAVMRAASTGSISRRRTSTTPFDRSSVGLNFRARRKRSIG